MASLGEIEIVKLLNQAPFRVLPGGKQLTLAFAGLYIASTTLKSKPSLVWETEKSYPRYYIPVDSLHDDIKPHLTGGEGSPNSIIKLKPITTVTGTQNQSAKAIKEQLSVGQRTTTWLRFLEGPLKGLIRFERNEIDDWFENGALFAGIKSPFKRIDTTPVSRHIVVKVDGLLVAESNVAVLLNETNLGETYYLPATSIKDWSIISKSDLRTACPYKGEAWYLSINLNGTKYDNLIWYYQYPTHESAAVEGFISFYRKDFVEITVDGVRI